METRADSPAPKQLGPYRIEQQIGVGGMGAVYRAHDRRLERPVALKRVRAAAHGHRMAEEAKIIAQISHPNIVQVYDLLEHEGRDWIVMELIDGSTLKQLVKARCLELDEIMRYGSDVAKGLAAAHARGIVHRDLKTENVIITREGVAKILDFGLAAAPLQAVGRTQGTPRSMSPEQALGDPVDHRSDLFSLGVLLYECLAGTSPFTKGTNNPYQIVWRVCSSPHEPLASFCPQVPPGLSDLVDRLLEKDPAERPASAESVVLALQRTEQVSQSRTRVLFVDDEPDFEPLIRQWFRHRLGDERFELVFAGNGQEALDILRADASLHLVFTDLRMPGMDGLALLGEMGKLERSFVSVVVSAFGDMKNIRAAMNLGAFDFLTKPFDFDDLETTLRKAAQQVAIVRESIRLRTENQLLDERNKVIRVAFGRYLQGDPELEPAFEPLIEHLQAGEHRQLTLLVLQIDGFEELAQDLKPADFLALTKRFLTHLAVTARRHRGDILGLDDEHRLSIGFGHAMACQADIERARLCAEDLRDEITALNAESRRLGGPELTVRQVIDTGEVSVDASSGLLSGVLLDRTSGCLDQCAKDGILVLDGRTPVHGESQLPTLGAR